METFGQMLSDLWGIIKSLFKAIFPMIVTAINFILWVLAACLILPCVFVAGVIYPLWEKWGENF